MTHVFFDSDKINWSPYLSSQQVGQGYRMSGRGNLEDDGNKEFFKGLRYVRGYGLGSSIRGALGSVGRFLLPIASNIMETATKEGNSTLGRIGADLVMGKPVVESVREQATKGLSNIGQKIQQCGKGKKRSPRKIKTRLNRDSAYEVNNNQMGEPYFSNAQIEASKKRKRRRDYLDLD
jgi:hypothetical protein